MLSTYNYSITARIASSSCWHGLSINRNWQEFDTNVFFVSNVFFIDGTVLISRQFYQTIIYKIWEDTQLIRSSALVFTSYSLETLVVILNLYFMSMIFIQFLAHSRSMTSFHSVYLNGNLQSLSGTKFSWVQMHPYKFKTE